MINQPQNEEGRSLRSLDDDDLRAFHEASHPTKEQHQARMKEQRENLDRKLKNIEKESEFDPARALITDTLNEQYDSEIARLMNVPDGISPKEALDPISLKIYEQHLKEKDANIRVVLKRLAKKAEKEGRTLDDLSHEETVKELAETLFG